MRISNLLFAVLILAFTANAAEAANTFPLFDINKRKTELQKPEFAKVLEYCNANEIRLDEENQGLKPIDELVPTEAYGADQSIMYLEWYLMVNSGRALAGDKDAARKVKNILLEWSAKNALYKTVEHYDPYFALKRGLIVFITSYAIIKDDLIYSENVQIRDWIGNLVRRIDAKFNREIDVNNHRYLADSAIMLWGAYMSDDAQYKKGIERFNAALSQMRDDGALPLEARRGTRSLWYERQSLTNLTLIAAIAKAHEENLFEVNSSGKSLSLLMNYFLSGLNNQFLVMDDAAENYIPGHSYDFMKQDMGMIKNEGSGRNPMAFAEIYLQNSSDAFSNMRLRELMSVIYKARPLIDDMVGGNATCFFAKPSTNVEKQ